LVYFLPLMSNRRKSPKQTFRFSWDEGAGPFACLLKREPLVLQQTGERLGGGALELGDRLVPLAKRDNDADAKVAAPAVLLLAFATNDDLSFSSFSPCLSADLVLTHVAGFLSVLLPRTGKKGP